MNATNPNPSLAKLASAALIAACAMLAGCGHVVSTAQAQAQSQPASVSMGAVYFGDTMNFGEEFATQQALLVAANKPQPPTF
jgi:outer membrane lipopolysaccharide assembly protein LptE/RlpB